ncbi:hypothetical protein U2A4042600113 [Corynebacterium striatum]|nr:hypothetical protein U2A4042600113 [Corynebacterium striatum]
MSASLRGQVLLVEPVRVQLPVARTLRAPTVRADLRHHAAAADLAVARHIQSRRCRRVQVRLMERLARVRVENRLLASQNGRR